MDNLDQLWKKEALNNFLQNVENPLFPCLFGKKSVKEKTYIPFFYSATKTGKNELFNAFIEYTEFVKKTVLKDRIYTPLIVFFDRELESLATTQHELAWETLNWLHAKDKQNWPKTIPQNPTDPNWSFCFNGVQLFINMSSSDHKIIKSRNLGENLVLVINPRENFDFVASGEKGKKIRTQIRNRIGIYNGGYIPKELGFYGDGSKEWIQYQLEEEELPRPKKCPFHALIKENS